MKTVKPTKKQLEYQDWEFGIFIHFGIRTFYEGHRDWDNKPMFASEFNPVSLDCNQWTETAKKAGANYMVLVAKHHDGFALWPSKYTDFSVASSPWKNGKGDVVKEFIEACHKNDIRPGLYYSPAEWGNPKFDNPEAYDEHFISQISEILTGYGKIDVLWFDGCGSEGHAYNWGKIIKEIRKMQPDILIFNMGDPDFRWVGNEAGIAPWPCWNTVDKLDFSIKTDEKEKISSSQWLPAECDCRIREKNWFYEDADEHTVKSVLELMGLYYLSVGRGANLLLNIGPDRRGLFPEKDKNRLMEFGDEIRRRFGTPVPVKNSENKDNLWTFNFNEKTLVNHAVIQEDLIKGEHAIRFKIKMLIGRQEIILFEGHNIGHKSICEFPTVKTDKLIIEVKSQGKFSLRSASFYIQ